MEMGFLLCSSNKTTNINILEAFDQWIGVKEISLYKSASHGIFAKHLLDLHKVYCNQCAISMTLPPHSNRPNDKQDPKLNIDLVKKEPVGLMQMDHCNYEDADTAEFSKIALLSFLNNDREDMKVNMDLIRKEPVRRIDLCNDVDPAEYSIALPPYSDDKKDPKLNLNVVKKEPIMPIGCYNDVDTAVYSIKSSAPILSSLFNVLSNNLDGNSLLSNLEHYTHQRSGNADFNQTQAQSSAIPEESSEEHPLLRSILKTSPVYRADVCPLTTFSSLRGENNFELRIIDGDNLKENNNTVRLPESQDCFTVDVEKSTVKEKSNLECHEKLKKGYGKRERALKSYALKSPHLYKALTSNVPNLPEISQPQIQTKKTTSFHLQLPKWPIESKLLTDSGSIRPDFELYLKRRVPDIKNVSDGPRMWICGQCGKTTNNKGNLVIHIKRNHIPKHITCSFEGCSRKFSVFKDLKWHEKNVHLNTKPQKTIPCSYHGCTRLFRFRKTLEQHLLIHSGERPFLCTHCKKGFHCSDNLKVHERQHTGEKPIRCPLCDFAGRQKNSLNYHIQKFHSDVDPKLFKEPGLYKNFNELADTYLKDG